MTSTSSSASVPGGVDRGPHLGHAAGHARGCLVVHDHHGADLADDVAADVGGEDLADAVGVDAVAPVPLHPHDLEAESLRDADRGVEVVPGAEAAAAGTLVAATGVSCRQQIGHGVGQRACTPWSSCERRTRREPQGGVESCPMSSSR